MLLLRGRDHSLLKENGAVVEVRGRVVVKGVDVVVKQKDYPLWMMPRHPNSPK